MPDNLTEVPEPDGRDLARKTILTVLSVIPFAAPLADMVLPSPFDKGLVNWLKDLAEGFEKLEERVNDLEVKVLVENEVFMTTLLNAARIVSFTHRNEKHEMLRNAVLNSALPGAPEDDERTVFLNLVEEFSVAHVKVLKTFRLLTVDESHFSLSLGSESWRENSAIDYLFDFVRKNNPHVNLNFHLFLLILPDLHNKGLISNSHPEPNLASRVTPQPTLTVFGQRFIAFIESPLDDETS